MIRYIAALIALLLFCPATAHASCSIPPGEAGDIGFNSDSRVLQWCDGTDWYAAGQINPAGPNDGCLNPTGVAGDVIYNDAHNLLQYCDGDHWQGIGGGVDMVPAGFTFTDLINQAQSSLVTSNIVNITDLGVATDVTISGEGSPQFRINGGAWTTSGTITDGQTLQLRLTTAATTGTAYTATVVVGTIEAVWSASTVGADTTPNAFSFSDQTGVATSFLVSSNTITITGINSSTPVSVSGGGSPQISIGGGAWTTSGNINNGQSLQVRLTSSASSATMLSATVDVGGVTDQWDVTTTSPTGQQLFTSSGSLVVPAGVTNISAVAIGAGGAKSSERGGRGGDLRYITSLAVTPGETLTITIGGGGNGSTILRGGTTLLSAARGGSTSSTIGTSTSLGGSIGGGNGGTGGNGYDGSTNDYGGGGGGAGGYSGNGGNGGNGGNPSGQNGNAGNGKGGGGGGGGSTDGSGGTGRGGTGGGVGIMGSGPGGNGSGGTGGTGMGNGTAGGPGAGGTTVTYGGGEGGFGSVSPGGGGVRIIWGTNRAYPNTNTGDM